MAPVQCGPVVALVVVVGLTLVVGVAMAAVVVGELYTHPSRGVAMSAVVVGELYTQNNGT